MPVTYTRLAEENITESVTHQQEDEEDDDVFEAETPAIIETDTNSNKRRSQSLSALSCKELQSPTKVCYNNYSIDIKFIFLTFLLFIV